MTMSNLTSLQPYVHGNTKQTRPGESSTGKNVEYSISPDDIVIGIMGLTGAGKSSLIAKLTEQDVPVGHDLKACTSKVDIYTTFYKGRAIFLIDTPGFDDTFRSDTEVLKDVAFFLSTIYAHKIRLAGMIYLHRITDPRLGGSALKNLHMFEKLCGKDSFSNIVLATSMWDELKKQDPTLQKGIERERQLVSDEKFWGFMATRGSRIMRHDGSEASAWNMLAYLIEKQNSVVLDIQRELVDEHQTLDNTAAGQAVQEELRLVREKHQRDIQDLHESLQFALDEKDDELANQIYQQQEEHKRQMEKALRKQEELEISLEALIEEHKRESDRRIREIEQDRWRLENEVSAKAAEVTQIHGRLRNMERTIQRKDSEHQSRIDDMTRSYQRQSEEERQRVSRLMMERDASLEDERNLAQLTRERERDLAAAMERQIAHDEAISRRKGMSVSIIQLLSGTAITGLGFLYGSPVAATAGLGLARRALGRGPA